MNEEIMSSQALEFEIKKPNGSELALQAPNPFALFQQALAQGMTLEQMQVFQAMCERWEANEARKAFVQAMNAFKRNPPVIMKDATATIRSKKGEGSSFSYKYAPLDTVCRAIIAGLSDHGISHKWEIDDSNMEVIKVTCILRHDLGHAEETSMRGPVERSEFVSAMQSRAITVSYLERYTLMAATGLAATDDADGGTPVAKGGGLTEERFVQLRDGIVGCNSQDELKAVYQAACREASAVNDQASMRDFNKAKNNRFKELVNAGR